MESFKGENILSNIVGDDANKYTLELQGNSRYYCKYLIELSQTMTTTQWSCVIYYKDKVVIIRYHLKMVRDSQRQLDDYKSVQRYLSNIRLFILRIDIL